jgi:rare lipoprotein A (peptidoglycan hydrolase)
LFCLYDVSRINREMALSIKCNFFTFFLVFTCFLSLPGQASLKKGPTQIGIASWYGIKFQGRITSSGEVYDRHQLTAAHKTLPLQTLVKVTNLRTKQFVIVRINDRGPFVGQRVIDLSEAAAQEIGYRSHGLTNVLVEVLEYPRNRAGKLILPKRGFASVEKKLVKLADKPKYSYRFVNPEISRVEARAYLTRQNSPFFQLEGLSAAAVSPDQLLLNTWKLFSSFPSHGVRETRTASFRTAAGFYAARGEAALARKKPIQTGIYALMKQA